MSPSVNYQAVFVPIRMAMDSVRANAVRRVEACQVLAASLCFAQGELPLQDTERVAHFGFASRKLFLRRWSPWQREPRCGPLRMRLVPSSKV